MSTHDGVCPNCGYCPHCGRSNKQAAPPIVWPYVPAVPTWPMFPVPAWPPQVTYTVTATNTTADTVIEKLRKTGLQ